METSPTSDHSETFHANTFSTTYSINNPTGDSHPSVLVWTDTSPQRQVEDVTITYPLVDEIEVTFSEPPGDKRFIVTLQARAEHRHR